MPRPQEPRTRRPHPSLKWDNPPGPLSLLTPLPELEAASPPSPPLRRRTRRTRFKRPGWIALGVLVALLFTSTGGYLAYQNTLPTVAALNVKDGEKDVPTQRQLLLTFSRPVASTTLQSALTIQPSTPGTVLSMSGETQYVWAPDKPLADLTKYTVTLKPMTDKSSHKVNATHWSFTTNIEPHLASITGAGGQILKNGDEIDPGTPLKLNFNDAMEPVTINVMLGTQQAPLKWAADDKSATIVTAGMASGPLSLKLPAGGRDQTGHLVNAGWSVNLGLYYRDHEHTTPLKYPALIQIPNDELAWDQNGLQAADMIFEYLAEGGITRLTAIFQNAPDLIGPMRSARFISLKLGRHYKGLLFQSGESQATAARAASDPVPQMFDVPGFQFRTGPPREAPDNLMINGIKVLSAEQSFFYDIPAYTIPKARPTLTGGTPATSVAVDEHYSTYAYDPIMGTYQKAELGHPYADAGTRVPTRIEMLVVLHTQEWLLNVGDGHGAHIHDYELDSGGPVNIYYKGQGYSGTWTSPDRNGPLIFTLASGQVVSMPPGLVWIDVVQ
jgi:hypothetical protein